LQRVNNVRVDFEYVFTGSREVLEDESGQGRQSEGQLCSSNGRFDKSESEGWYKMDRTQQRWRWGTWVHRECYMYMHEVDVANIVGIGDGQRIGRWHLIDVGYVGGRGALRPPPRQSSSSRRFHLEQTLVWREIVRETAGRDASCPHVGPYPETGTCSTSSMSVSGCWVADREESGMGRGCIDAASG
jgi:hypothetical protein